MKKNYFRLTLLLLALIVGIGQMLGATIFNCGIDVNDTWYKGTGTINSGNWLESKTAFNNANLGVLTSLTLGGQYDTWDNNQTDQCSWNSNNGIHILIKQGSTQKASFKLSCYHDSKDGNNNVWKTSGGTGGCSDSGSWGTYSCDISGYAPGNNYTIKATWTSPSSQSNNATANFTIPGFSTTSTSKTFSSTTVGNNTSETISFAQHYGTALTTSNCSITGTNSGDFTVTNISETNVTVRFAPSVAGSRSATLTITDAHGKTCTITLSGTALAPAEPTYTVNVALADPSQSGGTTDPNGDVQVGATPVTITAPMPVTGYASTGRWTATGGVTIANATANPTTITATSDGTVRWTFDEDLTTPWTLRGSFVDDFGTDFPFTKKTGESTGSIAYTTLSLSANTTYTFKVKNGGTWYGNDNSSGGGTYYIKSSVENWEFKTSDGNCYMTSTLAGTYTFKIDYSGTNPSVSVYYPEVYAVSGDFNSWTETTNLSFSGNDGSYSVSINGSSTNYEFKVIDNSVWYGHSNKTFTATESNVTLTSGSNNIKLKADIYPSGTYTFAYNKSTHKLGVTYPTGYVVTFGKRTGGNTVTAKINNTTSFTSGTKIASGTSVTFSQTAKAGYTFEGWYNAATGGTKVSSSSTYTTTITAETTIYANYTANQYTVSFNNNGGSGATPGNITVTYGQPYGTLPAGPTPPGADQFVGWSTGASSGPIITSSTTVTTASNHTLYARFESTFTVTVQYKCGTDVLRAQTTTHASETSVAAEITAPEILGYAFVNWTGDNATFADATSATTTVNVTSATTIVANYEVVPMVYFKNNPGWDDVFVTFDCGFSGEVPSLSGKPYYKMTQLGTSDIYYCVIPSTYTASDYASWAWYIAFDNKGTGYNASTHRGTYAFNSGEFIGRKDFDPNATMFIPYVGDSKSLNGGTTYQTGCWLQYNTNYSAYKVRVNTYVQGSGGSEVQNIELRSEVAGATEFKAKVYLGNANYTYGVMLYKDYMKNTNDIWYTNVNNEANTITSATTTLPWSWEPGTESWQRCRVKTEALGDYIFTVSFATGRPMVDIEYPVTVGDFRLVYKDRATWNTTHSASWQQASLVFKKQANRKDTASFFISYGSSPTVELQKCTAIDAGTGAETWTKQGSNISLSGITSKGVYNFIVTQNSTGTSATAAAAGAYTGKFYVRTDASDGGWNNYKSTANAMTYTEYSMTHGGSSGPYSYYFMRHVNDGQNIKFIVANDYSLCLSDTLISDTYANEWIECEANVRFTYNHTNNEIHRAYISGSSIIADRFLVLEGDNKLFDADGNALTGAHKVEDLNDYEMNFVDDQNWIYETTVQAQPLERVKLTAKFNGKIQYFYGAAGARSDATTHQLIGGTGSNKYKMRVVYDFKTNRLLAAWLPNGDITAETKIEADVMIIRYHQQDAQQITFSGSGKLTDVKTVYGAMEFNKYRLNNQSETGGHGDLGLSPYERDLYFISFPFDVKLNDVFGFGTYGKHWIIEYYDGKGRAEKGYWIDSPTNWKFVTKAMRDSYTLKANTGYVLALDLDELTMESSVWNYGVENVYLYFPSTATVENIQATSATVEIDQEGYYCSINRGTPDGDRRVKDSYWHFLGVPSYANANHTTTNSWEAGTTYPVLDNVSPATWQSAAPYVYDWNATTNKFGVISASSMTFKPMKAYLAQYARDTLQWRQVNTTVAAPRRDASMPESYEFNLVMQQNGETIDQTFINLREDDDVTYDFDFNYDLSKMLYGAFTSTSNIYTFAGTEQVAANCLPLNDEQAVVQVGVTIAAEGEYTFAIPDGTNGVGVTLVDGMTGDRTNLALTNYQVSLESGTYDGRFTLEISPIVQVTTGIETLNSEKHESTVSGVSKKLIDGMLYIVKDGKVFDARGARVK